MNTFSMENFSDFFAVCESAVEPNYGFEIIKEEKRNGVNFLRFRTCLQTFDGRNRNRRLWISRFMQIMLKAKEVLELLREGGVPGENGHPIPTTGKVTVERILTIDPNKVSHIIKSFEWPSENKLYGIVETADDGNGPGDKFRRNILQGFPVSFSTRSLIPQRKNPDGSIDQLGPGRYVTSDRVYVPSHEHAYIDKSVPVKEICKQSTFETVMESFASFTYNHSDKIQNITDGMNIALESATMTQEGLFTMKTNQGQIFISPETKHRQDFLDALQSVSEV